MATNVCPRPSARMDLTLRLATLRAELAAWTAWMVDRARPEAEQRDVPRPTTDVEELNAVHAQLVEELERLGVPTSASGESATVPAPHPEPCRDGPAPQRGQETRT